MDGQIKKLSAGDDRGLGRNPSWVQE